MIEFSLWIECADDDATKEVAQYFGNIAPLTLLTGRNVTWSAERIPSSHRLAGVKISSRDLIVNGIRTVRDAVEFSEAGLHLMHYLHTAPDFLYARLDWMGDNISLADVHEHVCTYPDGERYLRETCVFHESVGRDFDGIVGLVPFRPGYIWQPYRGESYRPVGSSDHPELFALQRRLFPGV